MRIAIVGVGGVGGFFGARLAAAGHEVVLVARGPHRAAIRQHGLQLTSPDGDVHVPPADLVTIDASDAPGDVEPVDLILLGVKTFQVTDALAQITPLIGARTHVVTTQNGVESPRLVADALGAEAVWPGVVRIFAAIDGPGHVRHLGGPGSLTFADFSGEATPTVREVAAAFADAGVTAVVPEDVWTDLWTKFVYFAAAGTIGAVLDAPHGALCAPGPARSLFTHAVLEVSALAAAEGVGLPADVVDRTVTFVTGMPGDVTTSLQRDLLAGRRSELEGITGSVVRLGERAGVATPLFTVLLEVLRALEAVRSAPPDAS